MTQTTSSHSIAESAGVDWQQETLLYDRPHHRMVQAAEILRRLPGRKLLDVGCSTAHLQKVLGDDFDYFGCDIADHASDRLPHGRFAKINLDRDPDLSPFANCRIDVIHVGGVLEYLSSPRDLLLAMRRLLARDGHLVVSMIHFESPRYRNLDKRHPGWIYTPSLAQFRADLEATGWRVATREPVYRNRRSVIDRLLQLFGMRPATVDQHYYICKPVTA